MLKQQFYVPSSAALGSAAEMLQATAGEAAATDTQYRCSGCSPALMLNLGAENPHVASAYVPGDPYTDGMVRPLKPATEEHKGPDELSLVSPQSFT